jgi:hypothetical protein
VEVTKLRCWLSEGKVQNILLIAASTRFPRLGFIPIFRRSMILAGIAKRRPLFDVQRARVRHFKFPGGYLRHFMSFPEEENAHLRLRGSVASSMSASSLNQVVGSIDPTAEV